MKDIEYYEQKEKADLHAHLNLSMSYKRYKKWANLEIPNFPRKMNGLGEMHEVIGEYTRPRAKTAQDIKDLFDMSFKDAKKDNIVKMEASIDIGFIKQFDLNLDNFLLYISELVKKQSKRMEFVPELGIPKNADIEFLTQWCKPMLESGVFKNIDVYGPEIFESLNDLTFIFDLAEKYGIKKKGHVGEFSDAASVKRVVELYRLDEVQHGIGAASDEHVLEFLAKNEIRCNVCPQSNYMLGAVESLETHPIAKMMRAGVPIGLGTDDLLFFNRSIGQQIFDLVKVGTITEDEAETLLAVR
ncbi:MAG: adenosine deaminase [Spirochaetaceae bacterium]|nr:adenosine deaminase [Spirochaetaceae bacterium]